MKKYLFLLIASFLLLSCTEDVKFNNPAFQSLKDNVFWRAQNYKAHIETNGDLIIEGSLGFEKVTFKMPSTSPKTYILGVDNSTTATYTNLQPEQLAEFTTGENRGNGQIVVTEYNVENQTISGTFKFNAKNLDEADLEKTEMNFTEGVFYKIPVYPNLEY
jgi:outer membrane biogenesis lipoprotein LolB